jgi:hypothetical protein
MFEKCISDRNSNSEANWGDEALTVTQSPIE